MHVIPTPLDNAVAAYKAAEHVPDDDQPVIRDIAREHGVDWSTLARRVSGAAKSRSEAHSHRQALSPDEEDILVDYIRHASLSGHPPPISLLYEIAETIRQNRIPPPSFPLRPLGKHWAQKFRDRHTEIKSVWSRRLDTSRFDNSTVETLAP